MITLENLSSKLLEYRVRNSLTQADIAKEMGVSNKIICYIENNKNTVRNVTKMKVLMKLKELEEQ